MEWPQSFYQRRRGIGCRLCEEGRPETTNDGVRFHPGEVSDAYLRRTNIQRGLTVVVWRGRHVAEPTELSDEEATRYWREVLRVGRALEDVLQPIKLNYNLLGNSMPHLHVHIVPRYADDPRPGWPFPFPEEEPPHIAHDDLQRDVDALRLAIEARQTATET
jgi:diadenosine tetraphosphate (Ap4A) HIT family hydrolase